MIDSTIFRAVLGHYPTGVCVVTSIGPDGDPIGMSIGSFTSVSLDPPLVAFFIGRQSASWQRIGASGRFCVNVLGDHQEAISRRFAMPTDDRFDGIVHRSSPLGLPILDGVVAWIECRLHRVQDAGDHVMVLGEVAALATESQAPDPLLFHRGGYGQVLRLAAAA